MSSTSTLPLTDKSNNNMTAETSAEASKLVGLRDQVPKPLYRGPSTLLSARPVPVWAARDVQSQEGNKPEASITRSSAGSLSNSTTSASGQLQPPSHGIQPTPPSPLLAATKTTIPLSLSAASSLPGSSWSDFVAHSQYPGQSRTEQELKTVSSAFTGTGVTPLLRKRDEGSTQLPRLETSDTHHSSNVNPEFMVHQKRVIISNSDLEKQMDLSTPWNPIREHNGRGASELVSSVAAALNIPRGANQVHGSSHGGTLSPYSSTSVASQFRMTAELTEKQRRERWKINLRVTLLDSPYVPMTLRSGIFVLSILALALAASIFKYSKDRMPQQPSTIMAICVQSIAMVYLIYITYDEYSGKPLGLRQAKDKVKLANLSLTFNTLYDANWICQPASSGDMSYDGPICRRQRGLAGFLFLVLLMWVMTFSVSIFRVVERVSGGGVH